MPYPIQTCSCGMHYRPERANQRACPICLAMEALRTNARDHYTAWRGHDRPLIVKRHPCQRPACARDFMPVSPTQRFCSQDCAQASKAERAIARQRLHDQRYA